MSAPSRSARHRTAIRRTEYSRPIRVALETGLLSKARSFLDWGCGHGDDIERLAAAGFDCSGWDPHYKPQAPTDKADIVNLGFVLNVIEDPNEREQVIADAWNHARQVLLVATRPTSEARVEGGRPWGDGLQTSRGTFQKFYDQLELRRWVEAVLATNAVSVEPGIVFVFREEVARHAFLASRLRRRRHRPKVRKADQLYDSHRVVFEHLHEFYAARGRAPRLGELPAVDDLRDILGTPREAVHVLRRIYGAEEFRETRRKAAEGLQVYIALDRFGGRARFGDLPDAMRWDIRSHFSSYKSACEEADRLLFAVGNPLLIDAECRDSTVGKLTPTALYVHKEYLESLSDVLQVFEGCARVLIGDVPEANIVKLFRREPKVSYLSYPDFESDAHPALAESYQVDLRALTSFYRDYRDSPNPPVLHRKETFVGADHPTRSKFERLTRQEEAGGLLADGARIGTRAGWERVLREAGVGIRGHRLH